MKCTCCDLFVTSNIVIPTRYFYFSKKTMSLEILWSSSLHPWVSTFYVSSALPPSDTSRRLPHGAKALQKAVSCEVQDTIHCEPGSGGEARCVNGTVPVNREHSPGLPACSWISLALLPSLSLIPGINILHYICPPQSFKAQDPETPSVPWKAKSWPQNMQRYSLLQN